jgi:multidrug efflux system membrane fusion protein
MRSNYPTILIISAVMFLAVAGCQTKKTNTAADDDAVLVRTQPVTFTNYAVSMQYSGKIESTSETNLSFKVGGVISKIYVKEGDPVSRGQLLAALDLTEINAQVQQAKQNVDKANRDLQRAKNLFDDTATTLERFQDAATQQKVAEEALRIGTFNQQYAQIRANCKGTVIKKTMNEGELASPGAAVVTISSTAGNDWVVRFGVNDKDWALLKNGCEAVISIDAYPDETFKGVVNKITAAADPVTGTYEIEVKLLPGNKKFASGLFATVSLNTRTDQKVTVIPVEAFTEGDGKAGYVYVLNADRKSVKKLKVQIAFIDNDKIGIRSGLENVDAVVTDGVGYLSDRAAVKTVQ